MKRVIKFRGWNGEKMIYYSNWFTLEGQHTLCFEESADHIYVDDSDVDYPSRVKLMQYTGLKDCNGREIYEGDIVKIPGANRACWVEYQPPEFVMRFKTKSGGKSKAWSSFILKYTEKQFQEVIGNIHENSELLNS